MTLTHPHDLERDAAVGAELVEVMLKKVRKLRREVEGYRLTEHARAPASRWSRSRFATRRPRRRTGNSYKTTL
jgi:hypothetical protein